MELRGVDEQGYLGLTDGVRIAESVRAAYDLARAPLSPENRASEALLSIVNYPP